MLADWGHYSAPLTFSLGGVGAVVCILLARPARSGWGAPRTSGGLLPAIGLGVVAAGVAVWNSIYIGHHVAADRDPGVYAVTGRWLATHHSLIVPAGVSWPQTGLNVSVISGGMYPGTKGSEFQFAHLLPVLLAEGYRIGGEGLMFRTPAIIGAFGLCAVYLVGCRLIGRPWVVLAAVTALAVSLPELAVTRDTFSEPVTQVLLWSGMWLLLRSYEERRAWVGLVAGLLLGATLMAHIDAVAYLVPLPLLAAVAWVVAVILI